MKVLYVTTIGSTMDFFEKFVKHLIELGNEVDIATNEKLSLVPKNFKDIGCRVYQIETSRSPVNRGNLVAIKQIRKIVQEQKYSIVHCHTPVAAMCTRLACCNMRKSGTRIIYTAHGFHFYQGAPIKNWLLFYPVEKVCSYFTDVLITINKEDFLFAQKKMKAKKILYIEGVGIDLEKFGKRTIDRTKKKKEMGILDDSIIVLSVGELNENKNHELVIRAISKISNPKIHFFIAGKGERKSYLERISSELGVSSQVHLLGYREDIEELMQMADLFCFPSFREGLSVSVMEAMACGLPVMCSKIRGNVDLIDCIDDNGIGGGVYFEPQSVESCCKAFEKIMISDWEKIARYNRDKINNYEVHKVNQKMYKIYTD